MGWKISLILIENQDNFRDEKKILRALGKSDYKFDRELNFYECIYPKDDSINIGYYNGNIIISDDYQLTTKSLEQSKELTLTKEEKNLVKLFPKSEIVTVACHSVVNYHGYSVIENGIKKRLKTISTDDSLIEFGERIAEENIIYEHSYSKGNQNFWKNNDDPDDDFTEDQFMEDFTFSVAKRRLGFVLDTADADELMYNTKFRKYIIPSEKPIIEESKEDEQKNKWVNYLIIILIILFILFRLARSIT